MADIKKMMFNDKYGLEQAVLNGTKTMTRRYAEKILAEDINQCFFWTGEFVKPKYHVDDVVGIAQPYKNLNIGADTMIETVKTVDGKKKKGWYPACQTPGWNNKMFVQGQLMEHFIKITDVNIERVQDISDEDCMREGIFIDKMCESIGDENKYCFDVHGEKYTSRWWFPTPKDAFEGLMRKLNGKYFWKENPYMYVYSFKLLK